MYKDYKNYCTNLSTKVKVSDIEKKRKIIKQDILDIVKKEVTPQNFEKLINISIFKKMFELYDLYFFDSKLINLSKENGCRINICYNNRCTTTGGFCKKRSNCITIELSSKVIRKSFEREFQKKAGDVNCYDPLECMMLIFEHELVHALMFCFCFDIDRVPVSQNYKIPGNWTGRTKAGHNKTFMSILNNVFNQTHYYHGLNYVGNKTGNRMEWEDIKRMVAINSIVKFIGLNIDKEEITVTGKVWRKNPKRAKIEAIVDGRKLNWGVGYGAITEVDGVSTEKPDLPPSYNTNEPVFNSLNNSADLERIRKQYFKVTPISVTEKPKNTPKVTEPKNNLPPAPPYYTPKTTPKPTPIPSPKPTPSNSNKPSKKPEPSPKSILTKKKNVLVLENNTGKTKKTIIVKKKQIVSSKPSQNLKTNVKTRKRFATFKDKFGKIHTGKDIKEGECIFPFSYKRKLQYDCIDTGKGPWCATEVKPSKAIKTWAYCS